VGRHKTEVTNQLGKMIRRHIYKAAEHTTAFRIN